MAVEVLNVSVTGRNVKVLVRGSTKDEVESADARHKAIAEAQARGVNNPGVSGAVLAYPVDYENVEIGLDRAKDTEAAGFCAEIPIVGMP
jgi:predicted aspartyl protease